MPRARCPESIEAEKRFHEGAKLVDIARDMGVPEGTVRRWKSDQDWDGKKAADKKKETERSETSKPNVRKRKGGGQPGNKNAKGGPTGNIKAVVTGSYMAIHDDLLTDEEKAIYYGIVDADAQRRESLLKHLAIQRVRERRLLKDIADIRAGEKMLTRRTVSQVEPTGQKAADGREVTKVVKINQEQENRLEMLLRFEDSLTRIQSEIRRTEDSIRQLEETAAKVKALKDGEDEIASLVDMINAAWEENDDGKH